ncbi:MAG TPA: hypothetical protein PLP34_04690 [Chitinophagaceae bacterium]|nr:hypothetical protein [Chitinophagaceae bacterium]
MTKAPDTGHSRNVANFVKLISVIANLGTDYNPSRSSLALSSLNILIQNAQNTIGDYYDAKSAYTLKVAERKEAFTTLRSLTTRLIAALKASGITNEQLEGAKSLKRRLHSRAPKDAVPVEAGKPEPRTITSHRHSFDQQLQTFHQLISYVEALPEYSPQETDLKLTGLQSRYELLLNLNQQVDASTALLDQKRILRNQTLYTSENALVPIANNVRDYIVSVFGKSSPQYKHVQRIVFVNFA